MNDPFHHFVGGFQDEEFLTGRQSYDGIWRNFDMFDQIGVYNQGHVVQPSELYQALLQYVVQGYIDEVLGKIYTLVT